MARPIDGRSSTQVRIPKDLKIHLKKWAIDEQISVETFINNLIKRHAEYRLKDPTRLSTGKTKPK